MDPNLSTSDAHMLFGKLYRKERSPELQQKVDSIVSSTSDVFVRIKRIEDLDKKSAPKKGVETRAVSGRSSGSRGGGNFQGKKGPAKKKVKKIQAPPSGGFFARIFGTEISRWGTSNGTLDGGFFARTPVLSPNIQNLFGKLSDEQIKTTLTVFRGMLGSIWEILEPARYNILIATYQFLIEFVKVEPSFQRVSNPVDLITATIKVQRAYAQLLSFPAYQQVLSEDFPKLVSDSDKFQTDRHIIKYTMDYILSLEKTTPSFRNVIQALYTLEKDKVVTWDEILRTHKVGEPQLKVFRAPEAVMEIISAKARSINTKIDSNVADSTEAEIIRSKYLSVDRNGKLDVSFLDPIVNDVLSRVYNDQKMTSSFKSSFKTEPLKLMFCIMKDLELNIVFLFSSAVMTREERQHSEEVLIFSPALFIKYVNAFNQIYRSLEHFMKKHKDLEYSFSDYLRNQKETTENPIHAEFLKISQNCMTIMGKIVKALFIVVSNHELAEADAAFGKASDGLLATKALPIDNIDQGPRFIPYADRDIFASSRMNGQIIKDVLNDYISYLYNYLYIYRDPDLGTALKTAPAKLKENEKLKTELIRMGIPRGED